VFINTNLKYSPAVEVQINSFLQVYFASEPYQGGVDYGKCYNKVIKRLGSAKMLRSFTQLDEGYGRKCNLMYEFNALLYRKENLKKSGYLIQEAQLVTEKNIPHYELEKYMELNETLSAPAFVKRCLRFARPEFADEFPSVITVADVYESCGDKYDQDDDRHGYFGVLMFDGDNIGTLYSQPDIRCKSKTELFQVHLSEKISEFATEKSRKIVDWKKSKNGVVIYAGGEDFLGALNIRSVFSALKQLRETFGQIDLKDYTDKTLTFSAGVVLAHAKAPLSEVLKMVRDAVQKAKTFPQKDAFCLVTAKRSGEIVDFVQPFYLGSDNSLDILDKFVDYFAKEKLSVKVLFQLGTELARIAKVNDEVLSEKTKKEMFFAEVQRILRQSKFPDETRKEIIINEICDLLNLVASAFKLEELLTYLRVVAFIARERRAIR
jgi:CRISPR-associated protein Cmr2